MVKNDKRFRTKPIGWAMLSLFMCLTTFVLLCNVSSLNELKASTLLPDPFSSSSRDNSQLSTENSTTLDDNSLKYSNPAYGFDISYPSDWSYTESEIPSNATIYSVVDFYPPISSDSNLQTNLQIGIQALDAIQPPDLNLYARDSVNYYRNNNANFSLVSARINDTVSGMPAYELVFTDNSEGLDRKSVDTGTIDDTNARVYFLVFSTEESRYDEFYPVIKSMLESFTLTSVPSEGGIENVQPSEETGSNDVIVDNGSGIGSIREGATFSSPLSSFTFEYPPRWSVQESVTLASPPQSSFDMNPEVINIQTEKLPSEMTLADYTESGINQLTSLPRQNFTILNSSPTTLAGIPAHTITHTFTEGGIDQKLMQIWTLDNSTDTAYIITYGSRVDEFDDGLSALEQVTNSFTLQVTQENSL
ncbi:MAG: PsbP-related protein [Nitrososphaeraceae archaeon]|jgi:hypothetical protein